MNPHEKMVRDLLGLGLLGSGPFDLNLDEDKMEEIFGPGELKNPETILLEVDIAGFKTKEMALKDIFRRFHKSILKKDEELKAAEETEIGLQKKLDNMFDECGRLGNRVQNHEYNLQAQSEANEGRLKELVYLKDKLSKIEICLNGNLPKKPLARDMKKVIQEILTIVTAPPEPASKQPEA